MLPTRTATRKLHARGSLRVRSTAQQEQPDHLVPDTELGSTGPDSREHPRGLIIVPAFNEERNISAILQRIRQCAPQDVLCIDDGSTDRTRDRMRNENAEILAHPVNLGYAESLQSGIEFALRHRYDYCVSLDADGQHDPGDIPRLALALRERQADLVVGSRFVQPTGYKAPLGRRAGILLFARLATSITGTRITDPTSGFKALSRRAMQATSGKVFGDLHAELLVYLSALGLKITEVPIRVSPRRHGTSMYGWVGAFLYPLRTSLAMLVAWLEARIQRGNGDKS